MYRDFLHPIDTYSYIRHQRICSTLVSYSRGRMNISKKRIISRDFLWLKYLTSSVMPKKQAQGKCASANFRAKSHLFCNCVLSWILPSLKVGVQLKFCTFCVTYWLERLCPTRLISNKLSKTMAPSQFNGKLVWVLRTLLRSEWLLVAFARQYLPGTYILRG